MPKKSTYKNAPTPNKVATIALAGPDVSDRSWNRSKAAICVLFAWQHSIPTQQECVDLLLNEEIEKLFGPTYFGVFVPNATRRWLRYSFPTTSKDHVGNMHPAFVINTHPAYLPNPKCEDSGVFYIRHRHQVRGVDLEIVKSKCLSLHRIMGCEECPQKICIDPSITPDEFTIWRKQESQLYFSFEDTWDLLPDELPDYDACPSYETWQDLGLKYWKSQFAGHTVIPPHATACDSLSPQTQILRKPWDHTFECIDANREALSARTLEGVKTRHTKRVECSKCYLGGRGYKKTILPCNKYTPRWCKHGAWTEEELVETTLTYALEALQPCTLEDLWCLAHVSGTSFLTVAPNAKAGTRNMPHIIQGLRPAYHRLAYVANPSGVKNVPTCFITRAARSTRLSKSFSMPLAQLYEYLKDVAKKQPSAKVLCDMWEQARATPLDEREKKLLAVWLHVVGLRTDKQYSISLRYGYGSYAPSVGFACITTSHVHLQLWLSKTERDVRVDSFNDIFDRYGKLPMFTYYETRESILECPCYSPSVR